MVKYFVSALVILITLSIFPQETYWQKYSFANQKVRKLIVTDKNVFYASVDSLLYKSTDRGINWSEIAQNSPLFDFYVDSMFIPDDRIIIIGDNSVISSDGGNSWINFNKIDDGAYYFDQAHWIYANVKDSTWHRVQGLVKSNDNFNTWDTVTNKDAEYRPYILDSKGDIFRLKHTQSWGGIGGTIDIYELFVSANSGDSWTSIFYYVPGEAPYGQMYLAGPKDVILSLESSWHIDDNGNINSLFQKNITQALIDKNFSVLYEPYSKKIFLTHDNFATLEEKDSLTVNNDIYAICSDKYKYTYIAMDSGIYKSTYSEYFSYSREFPNTWINDTSSTGIMVHNTLSTPLTIDSIVSNQNVFSATLGSNIIPPDDSTLLTLKFTPTEMYSYSGIMTVYAGEIKSLINLKGVGINPLAVEDAQIVAEYNLSQNYPNPFNPETIINYAVPEMANVTLKVYDYLGREVMTLVNEEKGQGNYSVKLNMNKFASGVYFYKMTANNFVSTKKLLLIK